MIENELEHLDPVAYLTASDADRVGQFFVSNWCLRRLSGMGAPSGCESTIFCRKVVKMILAQKVGRLR
jgi:hypothetical protein